MRIYSTKLQNGIGTQKLYYKNLYVLDTWHSPLECLTEQFAENSSPRYNSSVTL